ncbi:MAG: multicopper oxidase domain-containing protein, partial [Candidatus Methylomirabilaceae bacterium]
MRNGVVSRREFLQWSGQVGLAALAFTAGGGILLPELATAAQRKSAGGAREIYLEAGEVTWELAPGKIIKALAYNRRIPGPELRLTEGERVRIILRNALSEPTTI